MLVAFSPVNSDNVEVIGVGITDETIEQTVNDFLESKKIPAKYRSDGMVKDSERNRYGMILLWNDNGSPLD